MNKIILALFLGVSVTIAISNYSDKVQADISNNFVRLHVIANSDSPEDQALKLLVRDRIIKDTTGILDQSSDINATKETIERNISMIEAVARDEINKQGEDYEVTVHYGSFHFPTKKYGDVLLPAGEYEALRVVIGEGNGKNWWCVLFPPLCFIDATRCVIPEETKRGLKDMLTEDEYNLITSANRDGEIPVKIKFKIVEWWQNSKRKVQTAFSQE